jgi:uncharacterized membrane protein YidH (DUF202 family)
MAAAIGIPGAITILAITTIRGTIGVAIITGAATTTAAGELRFSRKIDAMIEIKQARDAGLYADGGLAMRFAMTASISKASIETTSNKKVSINKASINRAWLGIGIVTAAMLLASSAATSPVTAASDGRASGRRAIAADVFAERQFGARRSAKAATVTPRYPGRPTDYAPAYRPGPFILITPFFD